MSKMLDIACFWHVLPALLPRQQTLVAYLTLHYRGMVEGSLIIPISGSLTTKDVQVAAQTGHQQNVMFLRRAGGRAGGRLVEVFRQSLIPHECILL